MEEEPTGRRGCASAAHDILEELCDKEPKNNLTPSSFDPLLSAGAKANRDRDTERWRWSQELLWQVVQNTFHRLVFSSHHVAINFLCIFPCHVLSFAKPTVAKTVCLCNCMAHTGPREDEELLLVESTSRKSDSVLWNEVYADCCGKAAACETRVSWIDETPRHV